MSRLARRVDSEARKGMDRRKLWQINKYLWMSLAFVLVYVPIAEVQGMLSAPRWAAWLFVLLAFADGAGRTVLAYRRGGSLTDSWAWLFTYFDISLIALGIIVTSGIQSDLWLLYFVVMIFESLYATPLQKRLMDLNVSLAYVLATLPYQLSHHPDLLSDAQYARTLAARIFFLILVGALGRRISANTEARNREFALLHEQMATGEERARIAREVHDGLGHALVSSILRLELCARLIRKAPDEAEALLKGEVPALRAAWNEGRDLAFHLRPWELDMGREGGLVDTLRRHTGRFAERTGIVVDLKTDEDDWKLRPEAAFGLVRIVQEALTNAARHAQASHIEVSLTRLPKGGLVCAIRDDGKGFIVDEAAFGFGILAMRERAQSFGARFQIESAPGSSTTIQVHLSL